VPEHPRTHEIVIPTDDGPMPAFETLPPDPCRGGVVVVQEAFGVTRHIEQVATRLAEARWRAVAPALFHRQGSPVLDYDDFAAVRPLMGALTAGGITTDLTAALAHLEAQDIDPGRIGVVGFCMGGSVTLYAATLRPLGAAVTFYGGGVTEGRFGFPPGLDLAPNLQTPWLGLYGDLDQSIPPDDVEALRRAVGAAPVETEIVRYEDARHGFNCDDRPNAFDARASADAWARTLAWFDRHLAG